MARTRSPAYPAIPLAEAIEHAQRIFERDHRHSIPRTVAARHMGYKSLHGGAVTALSAVGKYGLLDMSTGSVRISDLAMELLAEPKGSEKWRAALQEAAKSPKLFSALRDQFGTDALPSDEALRAHLLKQGFTSNAVGDVIRSYRETMELVSDTAKGNTETSNNDTPASDDPAEERFGGARENDRVQWVSQGVNRFAEPKRVRAIKVHEDQEWVFVDGEPTGFPMEQTKVVERGQDAGPSTPPTLPLNVGDPAHGSGQEAMFSGALPEQDDLKVLHNGERIQIAASVGREGIARLKKMLDMYESFLAESGGDSVKDDT